MFNIPHAHIQNIVNSPNGNEIINQVKMNIKNKGQATWNIKNAFKNNKELNRLLEFCDIETILNSKNFIDLYHEAILESIRTTFNKDYRSIDAAKVALFTSPADINITAGSFDAGFSAKVDKNSEKGDKQYVSKINDMIASYRNALTSMGIKGITSNDPSTFFKQTADTLSKLDEKLSKKNFRYQDLSSVIQLKDTFEKLDKIFNENYREDFNYKDMQSFLNKIRRRFNYIGSTIWERVAMKAREEAYERYINDIVIKCDESFSKAGFKVRVHSKQTGSQKIGNKPILKDSLVSISIIDSNSKSVCATVETGDSTKVSQSFSIRANTSKDGKFGYKVSSIKSNTHTFGGFLNDTGNADLKKYWEERLGAYLKGSNPRSNEIGGEVSSDAAIVKNTKEAIALMATYDALAVRIGGNVQSLSFNEQIASMQILYQQAVNEQTLDQIESMFLLGESYSNYVANQISRKNATKEDSIMKDNYTSYINNVMKAKISVKINLQQLIYRN